jgi:hypothetical protein
VGNGERPLSSRRLSAAAFPDSPGVGVVGGEVAPNKTEGADVVEAELKSVY